MSTYQIDSEELQKGLKKLHEKLSAAVSEKVLKNGLSQGTQLLATWSKRNRFATLSSNRKIVHPTMLTSRHSVGYQNNIFGQPPSEIIKSGDSYIGKFGTNIKTDKGFSYPRLHEYGGIFHRPRPVLTPSIENEENKREVLSLMVQVISEALEKE